MKFVVVLCIFIIVLSIMLFFEGWFSHKSQVKKNQYMSEQNMYGKASFDKFRKELSIRNIKNAIKGTYNFHMGYWHNINMRK